MSASYQGYVDWNNDGDYSDIREEITERILDRQQPIRIRYGRDQARALSGTASGEAHFTLNNRSRDYSPENTSSPLNGNVLPARPVKLAATLGGVQTTLFGGTTDNFSLKLDYAERWVEVDCLDPLGQLRGVTLDTELFRGIRSGDAVHAILDAANWPTALRDIDAGASVFPFFWLDGDDAFGALMDVVSSEGPPALLTVDSQRRIVFRDRHHRLTRTASKTVQSTWRSSDTEPCFSSPAEYNNGFREIINRVLFTWPVRRINGVLSVMWSVPGITGIPAGDTLEIIARGSTPFEDALVPVAGIDYTLMSGNPTITLNRTSGASVTIVIQAGAVGVNLLDLQLRAFPLESSGDVKVLINDWPSIGKYSVRTLPEENIPKWPSLPDARAIGILILTFRAERLPTISVTMLANEKTLRITQMLTRNLSDRVHIVESHTGLDADCFIEQIEHSITQGGAEHATTFGMEKAASQITGAFVLGTSLLGTGKLGKRGFADPNMLILGTSLLGTGVLTP